jgi:hypothetical protein
MKSWKGHPLVGRWRIVQADLWNRDHLDLCGPAMIVIKANGTGEISFGAMTVSPYVAYCHDDIGFEWGGCEEGDQVEGEGDAEIRKNRSLVVNFAYRNGDEAVLVAERASSSAAMLELCMAQMISSPVDISLVRSRN